MMFRKTITSMLISPVISRSCAFVSAATPIASSIDRNVARSLVAYKRVLTTKYFP